MGGRDADSEGVSGSAGAACFCFLVYVFVEVAPVGERGIQADLLGADIDAGVSAAGDPAAVAVTGLADAPDGTVRDCVA